MTPPRRTPPMTTAGRRFMEQGRQLASERDDLIAQGVDPADLVIPIAPVAEPEPEWTAEDYGRAIHDVLTAHPELNLVPDPEDPWKLTRIYKCKGCGDHIDISSAPKQFGSVVWCLHAHQARKIVEALAEL